MSQPLQTCTHIHDTGGACNSIAATNQHYCVYHLRHRARLMRMAQARARSERFDVKLPPLESMHAIQSALTQLMEAVAADIIDLKRADRLIRILSVASRNLLKADKWPAPVFHSDQAAEVDVAAEYGLPADLDLDTPTQVAFPQPPQADFFDLSSRAVGEGSAFSSSTDNRQSTTHNSSEARVVWPAGAAGLRDLVTHPVTPEYVELHEIRQTQGDEAASARSTQMLRNQRRRAFHSERKRYAEIAMNINLRRAAQKLAQRQLAEAREAASSSTQAAKKPPASVTTDAAADISENAELSHTGSNG